MSSSRFPLFAAYAVLLLGIAFLFATFFAWLRFKAQIPIHDTMMILPLVESALTNGLSSVSLQDWLEPISKNAHRIVVTRILMVFDFKFMGGMNYALYASAWLAILSLVFFYVKAAGLQRSPGRAGYCFVAGLALVYTCSPTQFVNLVNPVSASWYVALAASAASVFIVIRAGNRLGPGSMLLACFFAAIAALSNFAGVLAFLILPVVALHQRSRLSLLVLVFSAAFLLFYFSGAATESTGAGRTAVEKLTAKLGSPGHWPKLAGKVTSSVGVHLGAPMSRDYPLFASLLVLCSVLLLGYQWLRLLGRWCQGREPEARAIEFCLAMATLCLAISCAIPLGRNIYVNPLEGRYQTITMVYWLSVSCLLFFRACKLDGGSVARQALVLLACVPVVPIFCAWNYTLDQAASLSNKASEIQILGRMELNWFERMKGRFANVYVPYIENHMAFMQGYGFAPIDIGGYDTLQTEQSACDGFRLEGSASHWPGVQQVRLLPSGLSGNPFLGRVQLRGSDGEVGSLYAQVPRKIDLNNTLFEYRVWRGYYRGTVDDSQPITLLIEPAIGRRYSCTLPGPGV